MVNVIIPVYKARETLPKALDSLVAQTKRLFLVTLVQDGDGENYDDIVEEYKHRGLQIQLIKAEKNAGPGNARQLGMDSDQMSEYFMFMDADDMYYPRAIEVLTREASIHGADVVTSSFMVEQQHGTGIVMNVNTTPVTWMHGKIYRASYLRNNNIRFLDEIRLNEDSYFNLVAVNATSNRFKVEEVTYLWRDNKNSLTRNDKDENFFKISWEQYIISQVRGILDIERITGTVPPALVAATLNNMYCHIMRAMHYNLSTDEVKKICSRLNNCQAIIDSLNSVDFWKTVHALVKSSLLLENELIFYKMRFCDWLKEYIREKEE